MAKRIANTVLNHVNWNDESEPEEAGTFQVASPAEIKKRVLKTAKRRLGEDTNAPKPFAGFGGFTKTTTNTAPVSFSFLATAKPPTTAPPTTNAASFSFLAAAKPPSTTALASAVVPNGHMASPPTDTQPSPKRVCLSTGAAASPAAVRTDAASDTGGGANGRPRSEYLQQLRDLNEGVVQWITNHVEANPNCILTPVFDDYARHLKDIQSKRPGPASEKVRLRQDGVVQPQQQEAKSTVTSVLSRLRTTTLPGTSDPLEVPQLALAPPAAVLSRIQPSSTDAATSGTATATKVSWPAFNPTPVDATKFSFGLSAGKVIGASDDNPNADGEEYVPPKNIVSEVREEDAVYSVRCKLFYKKGPTYAEKGVGTLYLKSTDGKTQLLVRAETSLGNILLNIRLTANLPTQRVGKNNVTLVCVANPQIDPKSPSLEPITFLIRVKDSDEADQLLASLETHKS